MFGVAVVFPVVITFGVDSLGVAPAKVNSYRRCAPVNNVPAPRAITLLVILKYLCKKKKHPLRSTSHFFDLLEQV